VYLKNEGCILKNLSKERIGTVMLNVYGSRMEVIEYINCDNILVKFDKGKPIRNTWYNFIKGKIQSPYDKSIYGVGYIGEGIYNAYINEKITPQYRKWTGMLQRCYSNNHLIKHNSYIGCSVAEEWHNFQNFAEWYDQNYYEIDGQQTELDKDILIKGNKVYSPSTCVFVSQRINKLFVKSNSIRGDLPIGVCFHKAANKFEASVKNGKQGNKVHLGIFDSKEEAFIAYKIYKEQLIKKVAEEYKNRIPKRLYEALINYEVEMSD
jgi:hypothetical protein